MISITCSDSNHSAPKCLGVPQSTPIQHTALEFADITEGLGHPERHVKRGTERGTSPGLKQPFPQFIPGSRTNILVKPRFSRGGNAPPLEKVYPILSDPQILLTPQSIVYGSGSGLATCKPQHSTKGMMDKSYQTIAVEDGETAIGGAFSVLVGWNNCEEFSGEFSILVAAAGSIQCAGEGSVLIARYNYADLAIARVGKDHELQPHQPYFFCPVNLHWVPVRSPYGVTT